MHQASLIDEKALIMTDAFLAFYTSDCPEGPLKYYSGLCTMINTVRDLGKELFDAWVLEYGAVDALRCVRRIAPQCNAGHHHPTKTYHVWGGMLDVLGKCRGGSLMKSVDSVFRSVDFVVGCFAL